MPESFNYGKAHEEAEKAVSADMRASTFDTASLESLTDTELQTEHARSNSATRSERIRRELTRRGL